MSFRRDKVNEEGSRSVLGTRHPERNFAPSLHVDAPLIQLPKLSVCNEQSYEPIVIGVYLLQWSLHGTLNRSTAAARLSVR
jgi:hypothetical protein